MFYYIWGNMYYYIYLGNLQYYIWEICSTIFGKYVLLYLGNMHYYIWETCSTIFGKYVLLYLGNISFYTQMYCANMYYYIWEITRSKRCLGNIHFYTFWLSSRAPETPMMEGGFHITTFPSKLNKYQTRSVNIMSSEKLCLKWNDFQENILSGFKELRMDKEFTDVTLACEDGQHIGAHKVVLATCSPLFMNLLKSNRHQHPLIYMRGVKSEDLMAIIDFLYFGQANVYQDNLDTFLAIADDLKLKGLTGEGETNESDAKNLPVREFQQQQKMLHRKSQVITDSKVPFESQAERTVSVVKTVAESIELDQQIKSMMDSSGNFLTRTNGKRVPSFICKVCGKEGEGTDLKRHIEANHLTNISHSCDICGKTSRSRNGLRQHIDKEHKN